VCRAKDGKYGAIRTIEDKFFKELVSRLRVHGNTPKHVRAGWPKMREQFAITFKTKTRDEWCQVFEGSDACFAPVLSWSEARRHPQSISRNSYVTVAGVEQPAPAPRFSRTPAKLRGAPPERGEGGAQALADWGFDSDQVKKLRSLGLGIKE